MRAITILGICLLAALSGCGGTGGPTPTSPTSPSARTTTAAHVTPVQESDFAGTQLYDGQAFAITYPGGWWVHNAEEPTSFGTATTIVDPANHARAVRVEVRADPRDTVQRGPGVRRLTFEGHKAQLSESLVEEGGASLRRTTLTFTDDGGRGITIVTQAPRRDYAAWAETFAATRASYLPN